MRYNPTERLGVNAIERIVLEELKWIFREQAIADVGIDAIIEVVNNGIPSCQFIASQIKTGKGNFHEKEKVWSYYASDIHYNYWLNSNVPVILVAYIPEEKTAFWISIESQNFIRNRRQWRLDIPKKQKLNAQSENRLLQLLGSVSVQETKWSEERILNLNVKVKNIGNSTEFINNIAALFQNLTSKNNEINKQYSELVDKGYNLQSPQTKKVTNDLIITINKIIPQVDKNINLFSSLYAEGIEAFTQLVQGCKELGLYNTLKEISIKIAPMPVATSTALSQIEGLKNTVDKFSKSDKELKQSATMLSDVLNQVIREFRIAKESVENILVLIDNVLE